MSEIEEPKSSIDAFELPCGYVDPEGNLHTSVEVREMTGEEEEILGAKNMPPFKKLHKLLVNCTKKVGPFGGSDIDRILPELTQGDRLFLLLAVRRVTLGDEMPFVSKCPSCEQENLLTIDLSELEVKKMPDPKLRAYDVILPKSKKKVRMKVLNGRGEEAISKAVQVNKDIVSHVIISRVETIDGVPPTIYGLKKLSYEDRNFIKDAWEDYEGGIETEIQITCPSCEHEYEVSVNVAEEGFFRPLAVSKAWKRKHAT